jgi:hypothetical protein
MRVLLDECVAKKRRQELPGHDVKTVVEMGWGGMTNGALLRQAAGDFDVFLAVDKNLKDQQDLVLQPIPIIVIVAHSNDINVLRPLMPEVRDLFPKIQNSAIHLID